MLNWNDAGTWRALLIDDEPDNIEVIAETLEFYGVTVQTAENGQIGLVKLEEFQPNLILLDLSMPVMNGWETLRQIRLNPDTQTLPVIALSAHAIVGDKERALEAGFDGYVTKPVNLLTIIEDLKTAYTQKNQER